MDPSFEPLLDTFDRVAETYGGILGLEEVNRVLLAPLVAKAPGRVLEIGCGPGGFFRHYFRPGRHELVAMDFSENMLREARETADTLGGTIHLTRGLAGALPFRDGAFDGVACVNTLHNQPSWEHAAAALREMARVLGPGGQLLVECRNAANSGRRAITRRYDRPALPQKAWHFRDLCAVLEMAGLVIRQRIALYGDHLDTPVRRLRPRAEFTAPGDRRFGSAPRFAILAVKSPPFDEILKETQDAGGGKE